MTWLTGRPEASGTPGGALQCGRTQDAITMYCNEAREDHDGVEQSRCPQDRDRRGTMQATSACGVYVTANQLEDHRAVKLAHPATRDG